MSNFLVKKSRSWLPKNTAVSAETSYERRSKFAVTAAPMFASRAKSSLVAASKQELHRQTESFFVTFAAPKNGETKSRQEADFR